MTQSPKTSQGVASRSLQSSVQPPIPEHGAAYKVTTSSLTMEMGAGTHALPWIALRRDSQTSRAVIITDSMSLLQEVKSGTGSPDWRTTMFNFHFPKRSRGATALDML